MRIEVNQEPLECFWDSSLIFKNKGGSKEPPFYVLIFYIAIVITASALYLSRYKRSLQVPYIYRAIGAHCKCQIITPEALDSLQSKI